MARSLHSARPKSNGYQTNVSALEGQARAYARISGAHEIARRPCSDRCEARQRPAASRGLRPRPHDHRRDPTAPAVHVVPPLPDTGDNCYRFTQARRLRTATEFSAVLKAPQQRSIRAERRHLSVIAAWTAAELTGVRFGVTVGRRNARRAVDRTLVKRIVREACRHQASAFERCAAQAAVRIDVAVRLKSALVDASAQPLAMTQWRRQLRDEADALLQTMLAELAARLRQPQVTDPTTSRR